MPRAFSPRPNGHRRSRGPARARTLPGDVVGELRRTARAGKAEAAISRLDRAVELLERGDAGAGVAEAVKAKALAPRSGAVREVLGLALYGQGRFREALTEMQAYRRMTGRVDQNHIIADCHRALGHPERAVPLAEEALASPKVPLAARAEAVVVAAAALASRGLVFPPLPPVADDAERIHPHARQELEPIQIDRGLGAGLEIAPRIAFED